MTSSNRRSTGDAGGNELMLSIGDGPVVRMPESDYGDDGSDEFRMQLCYSYCANRNGSATFVGVLQTIFRLRHVLFLSTYTAFVSAKKRTRSTRTAKSRDMQDAKI